MPNLASALVLRDLGDLELKGALAVDDGAPMLRKPGEHGGGVLGRVAMPARVRGRAHAVVEDAFGGRRCEIDQTAVEKPLGERGVDGGKLASQWLDPGRILVKHKDARRIARWRTKTCVLSSLEATRLM